MDEKMKAVRFDGDIAKSVNVKLSLETAGEDSVSDELYQNLYSWLCNAFQQERNHWKKQLDSTLYELNKQHKESLYLQKSLQKLLDKCNQHSELSETERPSSSKSQTDDGFVTVEDKPVSIGSLLVNLETQIDKIISLHSTVPISLVSDLTTQDKINQILHFPHSKSDANKHSKVLPNHQATGNLSRPEGKIKENEQILPKHNQAFQRPTAYVKEKHFIKLPQPRNQNGFVVSQNNKSNKLSSNTKLNRTTQDAPESTLLSLPQKIVWQQDKESINSRNGQHSSASSKASSQTEYSKTTKQIFNNSKDSTPLSSRLENKNVENQQGTTIHKLETTGHTDTSFSDSPAQRETSALKERHENSDGRNDIGFKTDNALKSETIQARVTNGNTASPQNIEENGTNVEQTEATKDSQTKAIPITQCQVWSSMPKQQAIVHPYLKKGNNAPQESFSVKKIQSLHQEERHQYERALQNRKKEIKYLKSDLDEALDQVENLQKVIQRLYLLNKHLKETPKSLNDRLITQDNETESLKSKKPNPGLSTKILSNSLPSLKNLPMFQPMSSSEMAVWKLKVKQKHSPSRKTDLAHCLRCHQLFRPAENNNVSCRYHRNGQECTEKYDSKGNLVRVLYKWSCCQREVDAPGCTHSQHI